MSALITTQGLADHLQDASLSVIDGSWHLDGRDARSAFAEAHIPGAVFLDLEAVSDRNSDLPHMLPSSEAFSESMEALGVGNDQHIVVYDTAGLFSAARIWWMLRTMGARHVQVLDGGLPRWRAEDRPVVAGASPVGPSTFSARLDTTAVATVNDVREAADRGVQIIDARSNARFKAEAPEPRAGVRAGHMPGAINLPYGRLLTGSGGLKPRQALKAAFLDIGVDLTRPIITTCGSGVTAAILTLALHELGVPSRLYDGSWAEWGARDDTPIATG